MFLKAKELFDFIFFRKAVPAIRLARLRPLEAEDLPDLPPWSDPANLSDQLMRASPASGYSLLFGLVKGQKNEIAISLVLASLYAFCVLSGPFLVYALVDFVGEAVAGNLEMRQGLLAGFFLCLTGGLTGLFQHHYFYKSLKIVQTISCSLNMRIFRQGLQLTRASRLNRQTGDIVNLLGTDSDIVSFAQFEAIEFIMRVLMITCASIMLIYLLSSAAIFGLLSLFIVLPLARKVAANYLKLDEEIMTHRDARVSLMSSILSGIRIVKYFAWEKEMQKEIDAIRSREIRSRRSLFNNTAGSTFIYYGGSLVVGLISFLSALAMGQTFDTPTLFAALALFGLLDGTIGAMSDLISILASGKVSADRIASFLRDPTFDKIPASAAESVAGLILKSARFKFEDSDKPVLEDLDLVIQPGEAVAIIGPVGAGKTSLLLALLGEVPLVAGEVSWTGSSQNPRIAYVPQEAQIMNGTLRENIELGMTHDAAALDRAVTVAALDVDIRQLNGGLNAEIGEQGINLSGGQKQRVNLARAARREAEVILLDDPISAVDFHSEQILMDRLIFGHWQGKTRIVVTHRLSHLKRFDRVVFIQDGQLVGVGTFDELSEHNAAFRIFRQRSESDHHELETKLSPAKSEDTQAPSEGVRLTDVEERQVGRVQLTVYKTYARAWLGPKPILAFTVLVLMSAFAVGTPVLQQSWLAYWTDHRGALDLELKQAILIWGGLGIISVSSAVLFQRLWLIKAQGAGRNLHDWALRALMKAPLNYFDRTPIGRILNRFSRDIDSIEREIATNLERTIGPILHTLAAVLIILVTVPLLGIVIVPAFLTYYLLQKTYRSASRDSQRLTSIARSPRFAFFKESLQAATVIRAHRQTDAFVERYEVLLRSYHRRFHGSILFNRWFSSRIPMLGAAITFGLIAAILWLSQSGSLSAGAAGLTLVYALRLTDHLNNAIRSFTVVESNMIAVERLSEIRELAGEREPSSLSSLQRALAWPVEGAIRFENVSVRYAPHLPLVLKNCDFEIKARQKVGIIGRTGAGKSTLFQVLYRFIGVDGGRVLIDGIDTSTIPLDRLRRSLAIIPQDPVLFQGSLRSNLDRFKTFDDEKIWTAVRRAHLEDWVWSLPKGLDTEIKEAGSNFSQGQRQQLCLARALLLDTKIIVLDEATASVDVVTDALIQETLRDECRDKTVLIIAHRLETLSLCDRVLEMKDGSPYFIRG